MSAGAAKDDGLRRMLHVRHIVVWSAQPGTVSLATMHVARDILRRVTPRQGKHLAIT